MKIYVDNQGKICGIGSTTDQVLAEMEVPKDCFGDITDGQVKCYSCVYDSDDYPTIRLLVPPGVFDQIGFLDMQHEADQVEVTGMQLALAEQYETNIALQSEVTSTQIALTELYEGMGVI